MKLNIKLIAPNAAHHLTTSLHNSPEILETSTECVSARHLYLDTTQFACFDLKCLGLGYDV